MKDRRIFASQLNVVLSFRINLLTLLSADSMILLMALADKIGYSGNLVGGNNDQENARGQIAPPKIPGMSKSGLFIKKNPGSPGKLGKASSLAESLSKLRGKGALK